MNLRRFLGKGKAALHILKSEIQPSFSQAGEDMIISYLFNALKIPKPTYLDIGANHPIICNNTFYFYNRGSSGVCIEPDPAYSSMLSKVRRRDKILNVGVANVANPSSESTLFVFPDPYSGWNTFSELEACKREEETGVKIKSKRLIKLVHVNDVMSQYFSAAPNLISLDVEGLDLDILKSIDWSRHQPEVLCVETISFSTSNLEEKLTETIDFVESQGYFVYADSHINTIFCRIEAYKNL